MSSVSNSLIAFTVVRVVFDGAGDRVARPLLEGMPDTQVLQQPEEVENLVCRVGLDVVFPRGSDQLATIRNTHVTLLGEV
jgi:hypothetical protein